MDAVVADHTDGAPVGFHPMQVRQRLAQREAELVAVELAAEEDRHDVGGAAGLGDGIERLGQARGVMRAQLGQALGQTAERQAMGGQHERAGADVTEAVERWKKPKARALVAAVAVCMAITYFGGLRQRPWQAALANVNDTSAQELFTFLRSRSQPSDVLLFSKPRSLALFSGRAVGSLGAEEPVGESVRFVRENGVRFVIQSSWTPAAYDQLLASGQFELVFGNEDFRVYRVGERME